MAAIAGEGATEIANPDRKGMSRCSGHNETMYFLAWLRISKSMGCWEQWAEARKWGRNV